MFVEPNARQLDVLSRQIEDGNLRVHVDRVYPFDDVATALDDLRYPTGWSMCGDVRSAA